MLLYVTLGSFFVWFLKMSEFGLDALDLSEEEIESLKITPFQALVFIVTWPIWLAGYFLVFFYSVFTNGDNEENN